jgi:hypothetical protein
MNSVKIGAGKAVVFLGAQIKLHFLCSTKFNGSYFERKVHLDKSA